MLAVLALLVGAAPALLVAPAPPAVAAAAGGSPTAATAAAVVTITAVTPSVVVATGGVTPRTPVTVTGTITPRTTALSNPTVRLVRGNDPLASRDAVRAWAADTSVPAGRLLAESPLPETVGVGASIAFTLSVPANRVGSTPAWGALPLAVVVEDATTRVSGRTFLGWQNRKEYEPLSVAVVAPITLSARAELFSSSDAIRTAAWREELAPASRLNRVLRGTEASAVPVTWAIDPAVLGRDRRSAAQVAADPVTPVIAPLVTALLGAAARHPIWALPYADPDVAATVAASPSDPTVADEISRSGALATRLGSATVTTGVAWPVDGGLDAAREKGLETAYGPALRGALVSSSALPVTDGFSTTATARSAAGLPLLAWDDELSRLTLATQTRAGAAAMTQEFIAETAALLGESPGVNRSVVVAMPRTIDPDPVALATFLTAVGSVPWLSFTTADALLEESSGRPEVTTAAGTSIVGAPQVDAAALRRVAALRPTIDKIAAVVPRGADYRVEWNDTLDQLTSSRWRQRPGGVATLSAAAESAGLNATQGIRVSAQTTNFLADEGVLQVTVINDLDVPVQNLRLVLSPGNPRMRVLQQPEPVSIGSHSRATVFVRMRAIAAGLVPITATLTTLDGTSVGGSADLLVRANPPSAAFYLVLGGVAGVVLLVGLGRALRGAIGRRRAGPVARPPVAVAAPSPGPKEHAGGSGVGDDLVEELGGAPARAPESERAAP
ncbi:MAG: DUF6049 family protein [Lapillicoccus sp.]